MTTTVREAEKSKMVSEKYTKRRGINRQKVRDRQTAWKQQDCKSCSLTKKKKNGNIPVKNRRRGEAEEWREEEKQEKYAERGWQCESQHTWTLKSERRGGRGGARGTQSAAYTTVPAGKRRYFCLRLNPYTACCSETPFMFAAFHWTQLTFKGYA